jgi:hypothetical protein
MDFFEEEDTPSLDDSLSIIKFTMQKCCNTLERSWILLKKKMASFKKIET